MISINFQGGSSAFASIGLGTPRSSLPRGRKSRLDQRNACSIQSQLVSDMQRRHTIVDDLEVVVDMSLAQVHIWAHLSLAVLKLDLAETRVHIVGLASAGQQGMWSGEHKLQPVQVGARSRALAMRFDQILKSSCQDCSGSIRSRLAFAELDVLEMGFHERSDVFQAVLEACGNLTWDSCSSLLHLDCSVPGYNRNAVAI